jgi:hypothetical protein
MRQFSGAPKEFWPLYLETGVVLTSALTASLHARVKLAEGGFSWGRLLHWRAVEAGPALAQVVPGDTLLQLAEEKGIAEIGGDLHWVAIRVSAGEEGGTGVIALVFSRAEERARAWPILLQLAETPGFYWALRQTEALRQQNAALMGALDLSLLVDREREFLAAAMTVCNELAARSGSDRVCLGWLDDDQIVRLEAVSQAEKFSSKVHIVRGLELAMEECLDRETEVEYPGHDVSQVVRDHAGYARESGAGFLLSLPIQAAGRPRGVLLCERQAGRFSEGEKQRLRLALDQVGGRLVDFKERQQWIGRRLWRWIQRQVAGLLQPRHTGAKLVTVTVSLVLLFLMIGRLPYRVGASFVLRSDQVAFVAAPFDGFVQDVAVRVGDNVVSNAVLALFDTRELLLQQSSALANVNRHQQEMEKARVANDLAEMRIAQAQVEQAKAALEQTRYHLEKAEIKAPFASAVVEGDLRKRIGSSFRQGDVLFQLARLETLYVELEVPERDAHEVLEAREAVIAFASAPERQFKVTIERVHPSAQPRPAGGVFLVRARVPIETQRWWRPGMSGAARIQVGWRNPIWILTHHTMDWARLHLWW